MTRIAGGKADKCNFLDCKPQKETVTDKYMHTLMGVHTYSYTQSIGRK